MGAASGLHKKVAWREVGAAGGWGGSRTSAASGRPLEGCGCELREPRAQRRARHAASWAPSSLPLWVSISLSLGLCLSVSVYLGLCLSTYRALPPKEPREMSN